MGRGGDGRLTTFLRVDYEQLRGRVLEGSTDGEILEWCYRNGRRFGENDVISQSTSRKAKPPPASRAATISKR